MHTCFQLGLSAVQTSEPTSKTQGNTLLVLLLCNVSYRDNCIGIRIVSWKKYIVAGLCSTNLVVRDGIKERVDLRRIMDCREDWVRVAELVLAQ